MSNATHYLDRTNEATHGFNTWLGCRLTRADFDGECTEGKLFEYAMNKLEEAFAPWWNGTTTVRNMRHYVYESAVEILLNVDWSILAEEINSR